MTHWSYQIFQLNMFIFSKVDCFGNGVGGGKGYEIIMLTFVIDPHFTQFLR